VEGTTKSLEKTTKAQNAPSHARGLTRQPASGGPQNAFGFAGVQQNAGNLAIQRFFRSGVLQAKLSISQPNDPYEEEADEVADEVMRVPDGAFSGQHPAISKGSGGIQMKPG
jgi:hypothetical protein